MFRAIDKKQASLQSKLCPKDSSAWETPDLSKIKRSRDVYQYGSETMTQVSMGKRGGYGQLYEFSVPNTRIKIAAKKFNQSRAEDLAEDDNKVWNRLSKTEQGKYKKKAKKDRKENQDRESKAFQTLDTRNKQNCSIIKGREVGEYVFMPMMDGTLEDLSVANLHPDIVFDVMVETAKQVDCLYKQGMAYTDIKPENVLYKCDKKGNFSVVLGDVGDLILQGYVGNKQALKDDMIITFPYFDKKGEANYRTKRKTRQGDFYAPTQSYDRIPKSIDWFKGLPAQMVNALACSLLLMLHYNNKDFKKTAQGFYRDNDNVAKEDKDKWSRKFPTRHSAYTILYTILNYRRLPLDRNQLVAVLFSDDVIKSFSPSSRVQAEAWKRAMLDPTSVALEELYSVHSAWERGTQIVQDRLYRHIQRKPNDDAPEYLDVDWRLLLALLAYEEPVPSALKDALENVRRSVLRYNDLDTTTETWVVSPLSNYKFIHSMFESIYTINYIPRMAAQNVPVDGGAGLNVTPELEKAINMVNDADPESTIVVKDLKRPWFRVTDDLKKGLTEFAQHQDGLFSVNDTGAVVSSYAPPVEDVEEPQEGSGSDFVQDVEESKLEEGGSDSDFVVGPSSSPTPILDSPQSVAAKTSRTPQKKKTPHSTKRRKKQRRKKSSVSKSTPSVYLGPPKWLGPDFI